MSDDVHNPVEIEQAIRDVAKRIHDGVSIVTEREKEAKKANHDLDLAYARAYMDHSGAAHEKRYAATLATEAERSAADVAEVGYNYATRTARALEAELRAWQSVGASIRSMYVAEKGFGG